MSCAIALLMVGAGSARAQWSSQDWPLHRGTAPRHGGNDGGTIVGVLDRLYAWPSTRDLPGEIVVDNAPPGTMSSSEPTGQAFTATGAAGVWLDAPTGDARSPGAWPPTSPTDMGGYKFTSAVFSPELAAIGATRLASLPNLGTTDEDIAAYRTVHTVLAAAPTFARWSFGSAYPLGSQQGTRSVAFDTSAGGTGQFRQPLAPGQRYAVYIQWPSIGTGLDAARRPNADHVLVRVSWGADPNNPSMSRIFLMNFGETGGTWRRVRTGQGDDRYFPYDGTNPIQVTLYALTPDPIDDLNEYPVTPIVPADAVRLVPEALRGDIHAPAASALFTSPLGAPDANLVFFGRDETVGPVRLFQNTAYLTQLEAEYEAGRIMPVTPFVAVPFDPTAPVRTRTGAGFNPIIPDPTTTIRTPVFYSLAETPAEHRYGSLRWRHSGNSVPTARWTGTATTLTSSLPNITVDDTSPGFTAGGFGPVVPRAADEAYGGSFHAVQTVPYGSPSLAVATWTSPLPVKGLPFADEEDASGSARWTGQTYTVLVWVPGARGTGIVAARYAHYVLTTAYGDHHVYLDQRNVADIRQPVGQWRILATGVRFPFDASGNFQVGTVRLFNDAPQDPANPELNDAGFRSVFADAVQFVPEALSPGSVRAAPMLSYSRSGNGTPDARRTVHFVTDEGSGGRVWALDPIGPDAIGAMPTTTLTTAFFAYPSVANSAAGAHAITDPRDDPNIGASRDTGIDGEYERIPGTSPAQYRIVRGVPALLGFRSSPVYIEYRTDPADRLRFRPGVLLGNQNGRLYALDPMGRGDAVPAVGDDPGVPGTTERTLTWPTAGRDRWRHARAAPERFAQFPDDPSKGSIPASPSANQLDAHNRSDLVVVGTTDGHIYAFEPQHIDDRIYRYVSSTNYGRPEWQFPAATTQLEGIAHPGVLTTTGKYIFAAGGRVYSISTSNPSTGNPVPVARMHWAYPLSIPGAAATNDPAPEELPFTAPVWRRSVLGLNGGREVVYFANQDGRLYAFDASVEGENQPNAPLLTATSIGNLRSSPVFMNRVTPNYTPAQAEGEGLIVPLDTGAVVAMRASTLRPMWSFADGNVGAVPVLDSAGNRYAAFTSFVYRGADATVANRFIYIGDEGHQDLGEVNGQLRVYADAALTGGAVTPDEPDGGAGARNGVFDIRSANVFAKPVHDTLGRNPGASPFGATPAPNTGALPMVVYEWGDSILAAAWGAYVEGLPLPTTVEFRLTGRGANRRVTAAVRTDDSTDSPTNLRVLDVDRNPVPARSWVATAVIPLGLPSQADPQTPGSRYQLYARAVDARGRRTLEVAIGQQMDQDGVFTEETRRVISIAHPLALTTRGPMANGIGAPNIIGWSPGVTTASAYRELLGNGNRVSDFDAGGQETGSTRKDLFAPLGFISHGASALFLAADSAALNANRVQALFAVDRSNLFAINQRLRNVRIDRREMAWGWNRGDTAQQATGNVMNPLPWEVFPNTVPNVSQDYPDIDRTRVTFRAGGLDMSVRGVLLGNKAGGSLAPTPLDLLVDVPRYQPANVNTVYYDIAGAAVPGALAPMLTSTGVPATGGPLVAPSAGYVGAFRVFVGVGNRDAMDPRFAFRQLNVGIAVPPDVAIRTEEETVDLGKAPHSMGYAPGVPFAPAGIGPYASAPSRFDHPLNPDERFFAPFTVKSDSNVNLVNVRVAKIIGNARTDPRDRRFWAALTSDQVETRTDVGRIWGVPFFPISGAAGNIGMVTSLDHPNSAMNFEIDYQARYGAANFWPVPNPYVPAGSPLAAQGWTEGTQPRPTLRKPRTGDSGPTVLSIPDVAHGDPQGHLAGLNRDVRPRIGIAVPLGTPSGTYSAPIHVFEDAYPAQWRAWVRQYESLQTPAQPSGPMDVAVDDDGILNVLPGTMAPVEGTVMNPFRLKITVREARMTNGFTAGSHPKIDVGGPFGANLQPAVWRDPTVANGDILLYWTTNRQPGSSTAGDPWHAPFIQDTPWLLTFSKLNASPGTAPGVLTVFDWQFANPTRWWNPIIGTFPAMDPGTLAALFPSDPGPTALPAVPGTVNPATVRHATPSLAQDPVSGDLLLFWQGAALKGAGTSSALDVRTFYAWVDRATGAPGQPHSFLNDPSLPKFAPRPLLVDVGGGRRLAYLFWYGGAQGRTRLFYNVNAGDLRNPATWSRDIALATPGALQWQANPVPVFRHIFDPAGGPAIAIDLVYSGTLRGRMQPELIMTRYRINPANGRLSVMPLPRVESQIMVRDGISATWFGRDLSWVHRVPGGGFVNAGTPGFGIDIRIPRITGPVNQGAPIFDPATGRLHFDSALGGRLYVEPQSGSVTFPDVAPLPTDAVMVSYTPQSKRLNASRNDSGIVPGSVVGGWGNDPALAPRPHVPAVGANTGPVAFVDRSTNPRPENVLPAGANMPVTRMWLIYRKTGANVTASGAAYYKTMRLMVRLPRGVLRNLVNGVFTVAPNITISGNRGPVEVDWIRGRLYFTEADEGSVVTVGFNYARTEDPSNPGQPVLASVPPMQYRVSWQDEISTAIQPTDQTTNEVFLPTDVAVNEGQLAAFKDPFQDKTWVFWTSTRAGTTDLYYMTLSPAFYPEAGAAR
ncbi:MAG TPA: hypothetical protein VLH79_09745 [Chthonomonadales bacterium]|nr:hypothetical protein [Chthonomonadales bacterium]